MWLAGIPVADSAILQLGASLREAELIHTAERLEHPTTAKPGSSRSTSQTARRSSGCSRIVPRGRWSCGRRCCRSTSGGSAKVSNRMASRLAGAAKRGGSFRIRPVSVPVSNGRYGRAIPPRRLVVSMTPAIAAASSAAMPAPAPNDVQSISLPPEVAGVVTVPG